jgi:hypothetical protein
MRFYETTPPIDNLETAGKKNTTDEKLTSTLGKLSRQDAKNLIVAEHTADEMRRLDPENEDSGHGMSNGTGNAGSLS